MLLLLPQLGRFLGSGYGLTECSATVASKSTPQGYKPGSVGRIMPYVDIKVGVFFGLSTYLLCTSYLKA